MAVPRRVRDEMAKEKRPWNGALGSGQGGIRTHDDPEAILVFETSAFNRSATCPEMH